MVVSTQPLSAQEVDGPLDHLGIDRLLAVATTPAFVYDENRLHDAFGLLGRARARSHCKILYSIKAFPFTGVLRLAADYVDGLSVSSLFEARLANEVLDGQGSIHITTPGLCAEEMPEIASLCDFVSFNSLPQWQRLRRHLIDQASAGVRINPRLSFVDDPRYDPCRPHSKLGAPMQQLKVLFDRGHLTDSGVEGLHFHTVCKSRSFAPLHETVQHIEGQLGAARHDLRWINLGGGYLFDRLEDVQGLCDVVDYLHDNWQVDVYFEPGKAIIGEAGYLVTSVIDLFDSDGKTIAVLDTSVNHHPEVFEYQTRPELVGEPPLASYSAVLAGCTCLSGDVFGEYRLPQPLHIGDRLAFKNVGAYSLIKANRFNGHNLPTIYSHCRDGTMKRMKTYGYDDYRQQWVEQSVEESVEQSAEQCTDINGRQYG